MVTLFDALSSLLCFMMAVSCFIIHVLSSPRRGHWIDLPNYVRLGFFTAGALIMYRAINLAVLSGEIPPTSHGHTNLEALLATITISYTFMAMAFHILRRTFPIRVWNRLKYIEDLACCANGGALAVLASLGFKVVPPNASPEAVRKASDINA